VQVKIYATLRDLVGISKTEINLPEPTPASQVLNHLGRLYPALEPKIFDGIGRLKGSITVLLNGRSLEYLDGLDTLVTDTDKLSLFPPVGGG
jgi:sulfur-carrier protein